MRYALKLDESKSELVIQGLKSDIGMPYIGRFKDTWYAGVDQVETKSKYEAVLIALYDEYQVNDAIKKKVTRSS